MPEKSTKPNHKPLPAPVKWAAGLLCTLLGVCALVYYWRVFYSYGQYPFAHIPAVPLTAILCGVATAGWGIAYLLHCKVKSFSAKAAAAVFCVGLLFAFINPPLQAPDEGPHYLRAYAIGTGHFDFDANRTYPADVDALFRTFSIAWTSAHDGNAIKGRTEGAFENPLPKDIVRGECVANHYADYAKLLANDADTIAIYGAPDASRIKEPVLFVILPLLPQAIGIAIAKLLGFGALGCLYAARIANVAAYALLCYAALKNCKRYRPVFTAVMLMPLALFIAGSCSYDGVILGIYFFTASYYCKDEITTRDVWLFTAAFAVMCSAKINNLLWITLLLVLPKKAWKTKLKKWHTALIALGGFAVLYAGITGWNAVAMHNYPEIGRMIEGVNQAAQLRFIFENPLRTAAVFWGTLYENSFFLSGLGSFGNVDLHITAVGTLSVLVLVLGAALSVHEKSSLSPRSAVGLFGLAAAYTASVLAGLYITYTPVAMVRVIGLQTRYFIPVILMLLVLLAALLSHVLAPRFDTHGSEKAQNTCLILCTAFGVISAVLLYQHYFVGPVAIVPLA